MDPRLIERLLRHVSDTEAEEISCSECFGLLSTGVELELAGATSAPSLTRLAQHLGQCDACREEYETLRDFVRTETEGVPPPLEGTSPAGPAARPHPPRLSGGCPVSRHVRFRPNPTRKG